MDLPVMPPVAPMLSKGVATLDALPDGAELVFEPKWDGFRCIVFRDGDDVVLGSRNERPLTRYFPELVEALQRELPARIVVDGEVVVPGATGLDFDALQQRIHPAESRVRRLAAETPAAFIAFDLLALGAKDLTEQPFTARRAALEAALAEVQPPVHLTPATTSIAEAADWFTRFEGAGLDGVVAKPADIAYLPDKRVMFKVKHHRTAECAVAGFRMHKDGKGVGSLLLGLYDGERTLHHVGVCASFTAKFRVELLNDLKPLQKNALDDHPWRGWAEMSGAGRMPGAVSRWNAQKDLSWEPVRVERVVEVEFDQLQSSRFRRVARFIRWRPDKKPAACTYDQLDVAVPLELRDVFTS
ncbi:MAG TPA: ATP-dependent DNA ligase [Acidimicrobiales bacterium]|jgi:ATP-dependent DNA ligase|nr:ATP-dependent DNA ligase [Acidimicrobiales bacterium]